MRKLLLPAICVLALIACNNNAVNQKSGKNETTDIITITDNGHTYADTLTVRTGGVIIARESEPTKPIVTEGTGTERFTSAVDKQLANDSSGIYGCFIHKSAQFTLFNLIYDNPSPQFPVSFDIAATGPINGGTGVYKYSGVSDSAMTELNRKDTTHGTGIFGTTFSETFNEGQRYTIDSSVINVSKATETIIEATFQLWLSNKSGSKTVTGNIMCNSANSFSVPANGKTHGATKKVFLKSTGSAIREF